MLEQVYRGESLSVSQADTFFSEVVKGNVSEVVLSSMLTALKIKGETASEIAGAASALRASANPFPRPDYRFFDCVGTGGDGHHTINISTTSAIVAASMGLKIAKHGNRSVSSKSGSADLLEAFGIDLMMSADKARRCLDQVNICFLFAPAYHPGFKHAGAVRQALKTRTIFNCLGPLVNPAKPDGFLLGVYAEHLLKPFAEALQILGVENAWVVYGDGLDEISLHGQTQVVAVNQGSITEHRYSAQDFGLATVSINAIKGGNPEENAAIVKAILSGNGNAAHNAAVAANVAALLLINDKADNLKQATQLVLEQLSSGKALDTLNQWIALSQQENN